MTHVPRAFAAALAACLAFISPAPAADYPTGPVKIIVPFPPGGSSDLVTRLVAGYLGTLWKQTVIVENRPGGNGMLGPTAVSKSPADGYTLALAPPSVASVFATMNVVPIDPQKDLSPISQLVESPLVVLVHGKTPFKTLRELVDHAKANPGKLNSGSYAMGSRLNSGRLNVAGNVQLRDVGYRGEALMIAAVAAGEIEVGVASPVGLAEFLAKGQLRILAVSSEQRLPAFPDVPTSREAGFPAFNPTAWFGLFAPANTPIEIRRFIAAGVNEWAKTKEAADKLAAVGFSPKASTPEQMGEFLANEIKAANEIAKVIGIEKQ
jgi:tripartite-type tricarboxylate transporter receptor subunit TctC